MTVPLAPPALLEAAAEAAGPLEVEDPAKPWVVPPERIHSVLAALRDDPRLAMNSLMNLTAVDRPEQGQIEIVYHLCSLRHHHEVAVKTLCDRGSPHAPTAVDLWPAADWFEREVFDLFGVVFDGHPDLRRILCPDDWVGHPLLRDYELPKDVHITTDRDD
ncbi:NADH-quinone oxidoreductase subunit C [Candidatus Sumerlaeota bacterium]|nr:NADH-quinone oxidoreductase subunit C [Candidatus Sumerlaeota bacterium]